jgi:tetratricopeptide (TPR) repeat protein
MQALQPKEAQIRYLLGENAEASGALEKAATFYQAAIELRPDYFEPYQALARLHLRGNRAKEAFLVLNQAREKLPASALVENGIGEAHLLAVEHQKAFVAFARALELNPTYNTARYNMGQTLLRLGRLDEARKHLEALEQRDKYYPGLPQSIGAIYYREQRYDKASSAYQRALIAKEVTIDTRVAAVRVFIKTKQYDLALQHAEQALRTDPTRTETRALRAEAYLGQGKLRVALLGIEDALSREKRADFYVVLAQIKKREHNAVEAIRAYAAALKQKPKNLEIRYERAKLLVESGTVRDGAEELRVVIAAKPNFAPAHFLLGVAESALGHEEQAAKYWARAGQLDGSLGEAHYRLGQYHFDNLRFAQAMPLLNKAIKVATKDATWLSAAWFTLGKAAHQRNQRAEVIRAFKRYLELAGPNEPGRQEAQRVLASLGQRP